jgi:hypothetical protein
MNQPKPDVRPLAPLALPTYLVALMLAILPLMELGSAIGSFLPGDLRWRFGAVGLVSGSIAGVVLGLFLAVVAAHLLQHRWALRVLSIAAGIAAFLFLCLIALFTLDALQVRGQVQPQALRSFAIASFRALLSLGVGFVVTTAIAYTGSRLAFGREKRARAASSSETSLLVGRPSATS